MSNILSTVVPYYEPVLTYCVHNAMNRSGDAMNAIARVQDNSTDFKISADAEIRTPELLIRRPTSNRLSLA
jgi:hypothetical protein